MARTSSTRLRVLSYNIHKGFSSGNRRFVLSQIKAAIRHVGADLVCLQEVLGEHKRHAAKIQNWPDTPQFEFLADRIWSHYAYGKNALRSHGHHGNAILSKYPISEWSNFDISSNAFDSRGYIHAWISIPRSGRIVHCVCVHLGLLRRWRTRQIERIVEQLKQEVPSTDPLIVAGDFNDWSIKASQILAQRLHLKEAFFELHGRHPRTFPARLPILKLDRIYYRHLTPCDAQVLSGARWGKLSDHAALIADFQF